MKAPEWYRQAAGPSGLRPPPPAVIGGALGPTAGGRGAPLAPGQRNMMPTLPAVPTAPQGAVANAQLPALPALAVLPPPPGPAGVGGGAGTGGVPGAGGVSGANTVPGGGSVMLALPGPGGEVPAAGAVGTAGRGGQLALAATVNPAPAKAKAASEKAFMIPGLQARPYTEEEIAVAFEMIDLDKHSELGPTDITRVLDLCGEPEATEAEVLEMIRLFDPDGSGSVEFREFRQNFIYPPAIFRNFDLHKRDGAGSIGGTQVNTPGEKEDPPSPSASKSRSAGGSSRDSATFTRDLRQDAVEKITNGKDLKPEFIRQVYQRFVEIDNGDTGFVSYEAFCLVLRRSQSEEMRQAFDAFDVDRHHELDLRQFVVSLSMFTSSGVEEKVRFAFMMYDEDQCGSIARQELLDLLKAMVPHTPGYRREGHVNKVYSMHGLHPNSRVSLEEFVEYVEDHVEELIPGMHESDDDDEPDSP